jgi:hypothetical protein
MAGYDTKNTSFGSIGIFSWVLGHFCGHAVFQKVAVFPCFLVVFIAMLFSKKFRRYKGMAFSPGKVGKALVLRLSGIDMLGATAGLSSSASGHCRQNTAGQASSGTQQYVIDKALAVVQTVEKTN